MSFVPKIQGSYVLVSPQSVSVGASSSASVTINFTPRGTGKLFIALNLPSGVTATATIGGQKFPLVNGPNVYTVPATATISSINFTNSNSSAVTVSVYVVFEE